ncbi:hypothetical protein PHLGIDRAFT_19471 [Phlebiopsis gigantea 11061_1 CR5-6]|uniref:Uncharacterized protein n=1 Tax=Phlebiopsis gigantea (strain 11061_1 CR5-6) TaxID=745531 RepID=A0A0C3RX72_PHLG1|nr:hypothetical protein PHLGIDRAFT_19471 [Phlebiopsis gigantea 11061_1 CR5-6]
MSKHSIPQPPHSAGVSYKGLRAAIDPTQIPSPIEVIEADREVWEGKTFMTLPGNHVPLSTTDFVAIDQGNSSPKFLRMSTWNVPSTSRLAAECGIPIAAVIQPFAEQDPREEPVPLVDTGEMGPPRCAKCRGYINPWCTWVAGGYRWKCNLCAHETEVSTEYFSNLDSNFLRLDHLQRPELNKGTVDFAVSREYWAPHPPPRIEPLYQPVLPSPEAGFRQPQPMAFVFVIEITAEAIHSGFATKSCESLLRTLYGGQLDDGTQVEPCFPEQSRICIMSFDRTLQFYEFSGRHDRPVMMVVSDIEDVFVPMTEGLFVNPYQTRAGIENLLQTLPQQNSESASYDSALGAALIGAMDTLVGRGGQIVLFASTLPTVGPGHLRPREDESSLHETDKETSLYTPRNETWNDIGSQCAEEGIGVNMFLGMSKPIDIGTIGTACSTSGGEIFFHPRFDPVRDALAMASQLRRLVSRITGYSCAMRIRTSEGLRSVKQYGNFYEGPSNDLQFGTLDADKAIGVMFDHARTLDDRQYAFVQAATLYTSADGQRRVRVCNVALQVAALAGNVFRFADMDTVVAIMMREAVSKLPTQKIAYIHEELTEKAASILLGYRKYCAAATAPSQLIIPEAFRALPVYTLAMVKNRALKPRSVSSDVRNYTTHKILCMGVRNSMHHLYPRMLALHDLDDVIALPNPDSGEIELPSLMRDSHLFMEGHGVYLIDNEETMILWVGQSVSPQVLLDLFGVDDINSLDRRMTHLPKLQSRLSTQVQNILAHRYRQRGKIPKFCMARQNMDGAEIDFSDMLIEDQNNGAMSYLDYLCIIHKQISTVLTTGASLSGSSGFRGSIW